MADELIIPFESFKTRGVQNNSVDSIQNSFFSNVYAQAFRLVEQIDKANESYNKDSNQLNDIQNVITFTGRRGTGKTSSMLSFMDTLVSEKLKDIKYLKDGFNIVNKGFCSIPYTDASLMTKNEDIFEIVLSKMLSTIKEEYKDKKKNHCINCDSSENLFRKVKEKICEIYNNYASLKNTVKSSETVPFNYMEKLADKYNVRNQFKGLVSEYISAINAFNDNEKINYIIVCIDDIDMSQEKHMDIMQCIHQYLMIPKVIVLTSFNIPMLTSTLQKNFYTNVSTTDASDIEHRYQMKITRDQTYDFLRKIIPADMRIAMPSWKKKDYREMYPIYIEILKKEKDEDNDKGEVKDIVGELFPEMKKFTFYKDIKVSKKLSPKQLIMLMLAERTNVYLDICGFKLHFMQPESLRELSDLFYLTYNMRFCNEKYDENCDEETRKKIKNDNCNKRRENRKILLDYLNFKMLPENNFAPEQESFIHHVLESPMERRGRIIWNYYFKLLKNEEHSERIKRIYGEAFYAKEMARHTIDEYSLGSLYRALYSATRLDVLERKLVVFLLASLSFSIPQFLEDEKRKLKDTIEEGKTYKEIYSCKRMREAFRYSLLGTWNKDLFGGKSISISFKPDRIKKYKDLKNLIYAFMFCPKSTADEITYRKENDGRYVFDIDADPTAFIINSFALNHRLHESKIKKIGSDDPENIINCIKNVFEQEKKLCETTKDKSNDSVDDTQPKDEAEDGSKRFKDRIIECLSKSNEESSNKYSSFCNEIIKSSPDYLLKHTDMSYNVIKRVMSEMIYASDNDVSSLKKVKEKDPIKIIMEFYERLYNKLKAQDEQYCRNNDNAFSVKFARNPIVYLFLKEAENSHQDKDNDNKLRSFVKRKENELSKAGIAFEKIKDAKNNDNQKQKSQDFRFSLTGECSYQEQSAGERIKNKLVIECTTKENGSDAEQT